MDDRSFEQNIFHPGRDAFFEWIGEQLIDQMFFIKNLKLADRGAKVDRRDLLQVFDEYQRCIDHRS